MIVTPAGIAVLDSQHDLGLSRIVEHAGALDAYDRRIAEIIVPLLPEGGCAVDGGAFLGSHAVAYAKKVGPSGNVMAFEPAPMHAACLLHNVQTLPQVHVIEAALYSESRRLWMVPNTHNAGATVVGSPDEKGAFEVQAHPLDLFKLSRVDFIKLDVEGLVLRALEGATETLARCRPFVMAEMGDNLQLFGDFTEDVLEFMEQRNYIARVLPPQDGSSNSDHQWDALFVPKERAGGTAWM